MAVKRRGVAAVVLLSIITLGIYSYYWMYVTAKELQIASGRQQFTPTLIVILGIFFSVAGYVLLAIEANGCLGTIRAMRGMPPVDNTVLWVLLGVLIPIVAIPLIQYEINTVTVPAVGA